MRAVVPAVSAKPLDIHPHVYVSTWSVIGPLTFSDIYTILHNVALFVLMNVSARIVEMASRRYQQYHERKTIFSR